MQPKLCNYCLKLKSLDNFPGKGAMCKDCRRTYDQRRYSDPIIRQRKLEQVGVYGKSDRGRVVNYPASARYRRTEKGTRSLDRKYESLKSNPIRWEFYLRKARAHNAVAYAIKTGRLRRQRCENCGTKSKLEAHHDDYTQKLDIHWLCNVCHSKLRRSA